MKVKLKRIYQKYETLGFILVFNDDNELIYSCSTLELPNINNERNISCIPEGKYVVQKEKPNSHFKYTHFSVLNVKNRSGILIHIANYVSELRGCIAVGRYFIDMNGDKQLDINYSNVVIAELAKLLPDKFELEITELK